MRRRLKIILAIVGGVIVVGALILVAGYFLLVRTINLRDYPSFADLPLYAWARLDLSDKTKCSDGSDYHVYVRRGESNNLIVHFAGGGVCWDAETCSQPITITHLTGYYFPYIWEIAHATLDGIFQTAAPITRSPTGTPSTSPTARRISTAGRPRKPSRWTTAAA